MTDQIRRLGIAGATAVAVAAGLLFALAPAAGARVLRVGTYHGIRGHYRTIQQAVNAARQGDWILVAPGDYKTHSSRAPKGEPQFASGILMRTPNVTLRGMSRKHVIVDGTKSGPPCSRRAADQNFGPRYHGSPEGLNGIDVWEANDVNVENLTTCNFLGGSGSTGNEIWWNGHDGGGRIHGWGFRADYLTTTSTFYHGEADAATYGLFSSDWEGGVFAHDYASNFNDAGFYIGGCAQLCNQVIRDSRSQYNALGYSGTNSGGTILIEHNSFDHNKDGFDTNSQNNDDWPSPQTGACPKGVRPPVRGARTCWVLYRNKIYSNNDANVPMAGAAAQGPVGTGVSIEGRNDTVMGNTIKNNGAWGVVFEPYPDMGTAPADVIAAGMNCHGGTVNFDFLGQNINCLYDSWGNHTVGNTFTHNGYWGNQTNGDVAQTAFTSGHPVNCYSHNRDTRHGFTSSPAGLQRTNAKCGPVTKASQSQRNQNMSFVIQALCNTEALGTGFCNSTDHYPRQRRVVMHRVPKSVKGMRNPCAGVPRNPWCRRSRT